MPSEAQGYDATPTEDIHTLHQRLVDNVKAAGYITSPRVEEAFRAVPRHLFLPHLSPQEVYQDRAIMTKMIDGQYVSSSSQPTIMAIMLEQLDLQPGQRVLEIGAGTGYNAALMAHIVGDTGQVVTIDIDDDIVEGARTHLAAAGFERVQVICADGGLGYPDGAPYDRIILTVSSADITPAWREQLRPDGRFLLPLAVRGPQLSVAFEPSPDTHYWQSVSARACGFVGLRGAFADEGDTVQLSPEPQRILLHSGERFPIHTEGVLSLLKGAYQDFSTQVSVQPVELYWSLNFWLALHEPRVCFLTAFNEAAKSGILPGFPSSIGGADFKVSRAMGLLTQQALALLYPTLDTTQRPQSSPPESSEQTQQPHTSSIPTSPLLLMVRSYHDNDGDNTLVQQLIEQVRAWDTIGRPNEQRLHIRTYAREEEDEGKGSNEDKGSDEGVMNYAPTFDEHDIIMQRKWSRFIFHWQ